MQHGERRLSTDELLRPLKASQDAFACWLRVVESPRVKEVARRRKWERDGRRKAFKDARRLEAIGICRKLGLHGLREEENGLSHESLRRAVGIASIGTVRRILRHLDAEIGLGLTVDCRAGAHATHEVFPSGLLMVIVRREVGPTLAEVASNFRREAIETPFQEQHLSLLLETERASTSMWGDVLLTPSGGRLSPVDIEICKALLHESLLCRHEEEVGGMMEGELSGELTPKRLAPRCGVESVGTIRTACRRLGSKRATKFGEMVIDSQTRKGAAHKYAASENLKAVYRERIAAALEKLWSLDGNTRRSD